MVDPKRIERINDLVREIEGPYPYHADADEETVLDAERAICRAAAEISGLTSEDAEVAAYTVESELSEVTSAPIIQGLRRFGELAEEE